MKTFHPTRNQFRQMFRFKTPHPDTALLKSLTSSILDLKRTEDENKPQTHTTQREGVFYQLHERPTLKKRLMGFREWCEQS
jgi:hypothetical protein